MSVFSHKLLILKETFLLDNSLFIVRPSMYLSETTKWSKDRGLKCSEVFIITRFYIHSSLLKTSVQLLHSLEILKSLTVDQGQICLLLISSLLCQLVNSTESYLWPKKTLRTVSSEVLGSWSLGNIPGWSHSLIMGYGYCDPQQGSELPPEGLAWVGGMKFAHPLGGGHELLQMFPSQMKYWL